MPVIINSIPQRPWLTEALKDDVNTPCSRCKGTGGDPYYKELNQSLFNAQVSWNRPNDNIVIFGCKKCYGDGYLDWPKNIRGRKAEGDDQFFIDPAWNSVEFLLSALTGPDNSYEVGMYFNKIDGIWEIAGQLLDVDKGLSNFYKHKALVGKYLKKAHRNMLNRSINLALVFKGKACTNCLRIVPDKVIIKRIKETCKLIPALPNDKINYSALYKPDNHYPLFRLCDACAKSTSKHEIKQLKTIAFKQGNTKEFSDQYVHEIYYFTEFSEVHI
jgi:hypothetical protein